MKKLDLLMGQSFWTRLYGYIAASTMSLGAILFLSSTLSALQQVLLATQHKINPT